MNSIFSVTAVIHDCRFMTEPLSLSVTRQQFVRKGKIKAVFFDYSDLLCATVYFPLSLFHQTHSKAIQYMCLMADRHARCLLKSIMIMQVSKSNIVLSYCYVNNSLGPSQYNYTDCV